MITLTTPGHVAVASREKPHPISHLVVYAASDWSDVFWTLPPLLTWSRGEYLWVVGMIVMVGYIGRYIEVTTHFKIMLKLLIKHQGGPN